MTKVQKTTLIGNYDQPILVCGISWMKNYSGHFTKDYPYNGGKWVVENGTAHEVCNFLVCPNGMVYGHVETDTEKQKRKISLEKLAPSNENIGNKLEGVTVLWAATPEGGGRRIVGGYRNATVFRERQYFNKHLPQQQAYPSAQHQSDEINSFRIMADAKDAFLFPIDERANFTLGGPSGKKAGWLGESSLWYPHLHLDTDGVKDLILRAVNAMRKYPVVPSMKIPQNSSDINLHVEDEVDTASVSDINSDDTSNWLYGKASFIERKAVEDKAIERVKSFYCQEFPRSKVQSVESQNKGWDLEFSLKDTSGKLINHCVEVKGRSSNTPLIGLTPNEFKKFSDPSLKCYRLFIVCEPSSNSPTLYDCRLNSKKGDWEVSKYIYKKQWIRCLGNRNVSITEVTSAIIKIG